MSESRRSVITYILVFFLLLFALAIISPPQFQMIIDLFSQSGELILVLLAIAIIAYILKRTEEI